jgi:hypothetical protein
MAFPETAQDLAVEAYLAREWRNLVAPGHVRGGDRVTIAHGATAEGWRAQPSTCDFTLDNRDGRYSPRNPAGPYYGGLGRNTPLRVSLGQLADDFDRTVAVGWGTTATGATWSTAATGTTSSSVSGGSATHTVSTTSSFRISYLGGLTYSTVDVAVTVTLADGDITGAPIEPANLMLRGTTSGFYGLVRLAISTTEDVTITLHHVNGGGELAPAVATGITHTAGQALRVRAQAEGQTMRAKVWVAADPEPLDWQITAHAPLLPAAGWVGVRSGVAGGNTDTPVVFAYSDIEVRSPRWSGEVSQWPISSDTSGTDVTTSIRGSGLLRRLGQGSAPLRSALYRGMTSESITRPRAYWPCEDGESATVFGSGIDGGHRMHLRGDVDPASWSSAPATEDIPTWNVGYAVGAVRAFPSTGYLRLMAFVSIPTSLGGDRVIMSMTTTGTARNWSLAVNAAGSLIVRAIDSSGANILTDSWGFNLLGQTGLVWIYLIQNGTAIDWQIGSASIDTGVLGVGSGTLASRTFVRTPQVTIGAPGGDLEGMAIGHVTVLDTDEFWSVIDFARAWTGETAAARLQRLAAEEGIPLALDLGPDGDTSPRMGPQRPGTFLALAEECAVADQGTLADARGAAALLYRSRASHYNQTSALVVGYSDLRQPFEPVDDDRVINRATAARTGGSSVTVERTTGPLSVAPPPTGIGRYDSGGSTTVNVASDQQLGDHAAWTVHLGTVDEPRWPNIGVNLAATPALRDDVLRLTLGARLDIADPPHWLPPDDIATIVRGYREVLGRYEHTIRWALLPESPYRVGVVGDDVLGRVDTQSSELDSGVDATDTTLSVATLAGPRWITSAAYASHFPFDIRVGGEVMTVTAISGGSSPQSFTVTRSINGVIKGHDAGAIVALAQPSIVAR